MLPAFSKGFKNNCYFKISSSFKNIHICTFLFTNINYYKNYKNIFRKLSKRCRCFLLMAHLIIMTFEIIFCFSYGYSFICEIKLYMYYLSNEIRIGRKIDNSIVSF